MTATAKSAPARSGDSRAIEVRALTAAVGAEIRGVDLAQVSDAQFAQIESAWTRHSALLFRSQQHLRLAVARRLLRCCRLGFASQARFVGLLAARDEKVH